MNRHNIRAHTILFTEDCPLDCRYCQLKLESDYNTCQGQSFEEILAKIHQYDIQDKEDNVETQLTFTGGEPFLYWEWIKKIIEQYQHRFIYHFNTSGYCFTKEILEFLSHYQVYFTLSIDGGEKLTNYLRPVKGHPGGVGYFQKIQQIAPYLTYYFPQVVCKLIINNRYTDLLYQTYLDMEKLGFKFITLILDFNARPHIEGTSKQIQRVWNDEDTKILQEQIDLILEEIILGFSQGLQRTQITNINSIMSFLLSKTDNYSPDNLVCNVFKGRTLETLQNPNERHCFEGSFSTLEQAKQALIDEFNSLNGKCPLDNECPAFLYCANTNCPISSFQATKTYFGADSLECILAKISYEAAIKILTICNEICPNSPAYIHYLNSFNYSGKKEEIDNGSNSFLSLQPNQC